MQRGRPNTLSILERAQGQLSGKRFGKKTSKPSQSMDNDDDDEEDELKAYLSQLQQRTTKQFKDLSGDESDESYRPNKSALIQSGSQFLKSNRAAKDPPVKNPPSALIRKDVSGTTEDKTRFNTNVVSASEESSDISDISDQVSSHNSLELKKSSHRFLKEKQNDQVIDARQSSKKTAISKPPLKTSTPTRPVKSSAFERIMSNLGSDEDDVESLIKSVESTPKSPKVDIKVAVRPESPPALPSHSSDRNSSTEDIADEILSQEESEIISSVASDSSKGLPKINVFQAADLEASLQPAIVDDKKKEAPSRIFTKTNKQKESNVTEIESDIQEIQSDIETDIHTGTESYKGDSGGSDEDTDAHTYSSVASEHSKGSPVKSESVDSISSPSKGTTVSQRSQTVTESKSVSSSYTDDFHSETTKSKSASSSGTLTPWPSATPTPRRPPKPKKSEKHSPTPSPSPSPSPSPTPSPTPRRSRRHRVHVKDTGVQTSYTQRQDHWLFGHSAQGHRVDVTSLLQQHRSSSIPPETLYTVSSLDATSLLLHQTLKLQFQQTQQSIEKMLQVHQSLLESVQGDYAYTTLKDTHAYIERHRKSKE